jgi:hypothetical protein
VALARASRQWAAPLMVAACAVACSGGEDARDGGAQAPPVDAAPPVAIPEGFPRDIPIYPGAVPGFASGSAGDSSVVTLATTDPPDKAYAFYREKLAGEGWHTEAEMQLGPQRLLSARRGELLASVVIADSEQGGSTILLSVGKAEPQSQPPPQPAP